MDIKDLKAQAYDLLVQLQMIQNKLNEINRLIAIESEKENAKKE